MLSILLQVNCHHRSSGSGGLFIGPSGPEGGGGVVVVVVVGAGGGRGCG